jgi:hypothetical protein
VPKRLCRSAVNAPRTAGHLSTRGRSAVPRRNSCPCRKTTPTGQANHGGTPAPNRQTRDQRRSEHTRVPIHQNGHTCDAERPSRIHRTRRLLSEHATQHPGQSLRDEQLRHVAVEVPPTGQRCIAPWSRPGRGGVAAIEQRNNAQRVWSAATARAGGGAARGANSRMWPVLHTIERERDDSPLQPCKLSGLVRRSRR